MFHLKLLLKYSHLFLSRPKVRKIINIRVIKNNNDFNNNNSKITFLNKNKSSFLAFLLAISESLSFVEEIDSNGIIHLLISFLKNKYL